MDIDQRSNQDHQDRRESIASVYNGAVASAAIAAAWELGALDQLQSHGGLDVGVFAAEGRLDRGATLAMFTALAAADVVRVDGELVLTSRNFDEAVRTKGFFHWLMRGSIDVFRDMPKLVRSDRRGEGFYQRDAAAISIACRDINAVFFDPLFDEVLREVDYTTVADLGCGSGERLIKMVTSRHGTRGWGLDVAAGALEVAASATAEARLGDRIAYLRADATELEPLPELADVDLVTCFLMGHDFWPMDACIATLQRIRAAFPGAERMLLGDTAKTVSHRGADFPVFTLGFEVGHALMDTYLPTLEEWDIAIEKSGWTCVARHDVETPAASVIFDLRPR